MIVERKVYHLDKVDWRVAFKPWPFADAHAAQIEEYWLEASVRNPYIFNGGVFVMQNHKVEAGVFYGQFVPADFASYLYWRDRGFDDWPTCDGYAAIFLRGQRGDYFLAKAADHTLNGGMHVPPGGLIDARDITSSGMVDISGYVLRELEEETGLTRADVILEDGYLVVRIGCIVVLAVRARCVKHDDEIIERVKNHHLRQNRPELEECLWYRGDETTAVQAHTKLLIGYMQNFCDLQ